MKRLLGLVLIIISGFITIAAGDAPDQQIIELYSIDGRIEWVEEDKVAAQLTVGWYLEPQVLLYAADGRQQYFNESEVAAQLTVGWYLEKQYNLNDITGRARYIYDYLAAQGYNKKAICAILGNMQQESSIRTYTGKSCGYGLVQWTGGRKKSLFDYCGTTSPDLKQQLDYLIYELNNGYLETKRILQNDNLSLDEMTHRFERSFERAGKPATAKRQSYARNWYNFVF